MSETPQVVVNDNSKRTIFGSDTLVPVSLVRWIVGMILGLTVLIAPWLTIMYYKANQIDGLEQRLQVMESITFKTSSRLDSMEPLLKETRDTVVKILTSPPYNGR